MSRMAQACCWDRLLYPRCTALLGCLSECGPDQLAVRVQGSGERPLVAGMLRHLDLRDGSVFGGGSWRVGIGGQDCLRSLGQQTAGHRRGQVWSMGSAILDVLARSSVRPAGDGTRIPPTIGSARHERGDRHQGSTGLPRPPGHAAHAVPLATIADGSGTVRAPADMWHARALRGLSERPARILGWGYSAHVAGCAYRRDGPACRHTSFARVADCGRMSATVR